MKTFVAILALLAVNCVVSATEVNCPNLSLKDECSGQNTCNWNQDNSKNICKQSVNCQEVGVTKCLDDATKKICQLTGQSCADNATVCALGEGNTCDTASGCTASSTCAAVKGGFNCAQYTGKNPTVTCDKTQPYCVQDPAVPATCDYLAGCSAASTTACATPCATQSVVCQTSANCSPAAPTAANCLATNGCVFTAATEAVAASCAASIDCAPVNTVAGCDATKGCAIKTYDCTVPQKTVSDYCLGLGSKCTTDPAGIEYCQYNLHKTCIDNTNYCKPATQNACNASNAQCDVTFSCANPQEGKCAGNTTQPNCTAKLCTWNAPNACSNITSQQQCAPLNASLGECVTDQTPGCAFTDGGACSTKSNGGNNDPQPSPSSTSGPIVVFSCAVLALVFAF